MKVAVIGHVEWCQFVRVNTLPKPGEIIAAQEVWHEAAGGGGVAAVQLAAHADGCMFFTSVGDDDEGKKVLQQLAEHGVEVHATIHTDMPTKQAIVYIDANKERTITTTHTLEPSGLDESLPWHELATMDAVYFVGGDDTALEAARQARVVVSTARELELLKQSDIRLDALVMSSKDSGEQYADNDLHVRPALVVRTNGKKGGVTDDGLAYQAVVVSDDELQDSYGCGDSFAAGLTFALGENKNPADALVLAAQWGAEAARRKGAHRA